MKNKSELIKRILELKKERDAVILAHNYQLPEVQDIADYLGDSLDLSNKAKELKNRTIVFCGVHFMAEVANILSPEKIVLLPDITSRCPLADTITKKDIKKLKKKYPSVPIIGYINTSAEVKSEIDYCCTSMTAVEVVNNINSDKIIFVPDKYLGSYVEKITKKKLILWTGYCPPHLKILRSDILKLKKKFPEAKVIVHPECSLEVQEIADKITGTNGMIKYVQNTDCEVFIVGTEVDMCYRLKKLFPEKKFIPATPLAVCEDMKKNNLEKILFCLEEMQPQIVVKKNIREKAYETIKKMFFISPPGKVAVG